MESAILLSISSNNMNTASHSEHRERRIVALLLIIGVIAVIWWGPTLQFNGMRLYFPDKSGKTLKLESDRYPLSAP